MSAFYISAAHKSSGKTTLSIGLVRAFANRGMRIQPFKKGPDYIDPIWHAQASGNPCYNLDFHTQTRDEILDTYARHMQGVRLGLVEGNKGLFDGMDVEGSNSNAAMAKLLGVPVILVINCQGMTRGIAPLLLGYQAFDPEIDFAGVILNRVGGSRHEAKLIEVVEHYTDIPVMGCVHQDSRLQIEERHLGLIPGNEEASAETLIRRLATRVEEQVDLDRMLDLADRASAPATPVQEQISDSPGPVYSGLRIGLARDRAFGFYYPDDLERFQALGVELVEFDTLNDQQLPDVDGIFIGGGFPETAMEALQDNSAMRQSVAEFIEKGGPVYAECGGLMYLTRTLTWNGKQCRMAGVIPGDTVMHDKPKGRGYVRLRDTGRSPWPRLQTQGEAMIAAHEFHYSSLEGLETATDDFAYEVVRGYGIDGRYDGFIYKNLLASYTHLRSVGGNDWVKRFVAQVAAEKNDQAASKVQVNDV
ncbi:MAG: cobyrinate a,c-diamide synthase [Candidatus Thiodiazotropha sp.]